MNRYAAAVFLTLCAAHVARADDDAIGGVGNPTATTGRSDWALQVTPYMWATGLDGDISPFRRAPTLHVEKSFSDVMDDLNFGGFLNIWGRYDRFVLSGDIMYVNTTDSHATGALPALQIPGLPTIPSGASIDADVDTQEFMATLQGGYRVLDTPEFSLDALGGVRFWYISNDVSVTASHPFLGSGLIAHSQKITVAARAMAERKAIGHLS